MEQGCSHDKVKGFISGEGLSFKNKGILATLKIAQLICRYIYPGLATEVKLLLLMGSNLSNIFSFLACIASTIKRYNNYESHGYKISYSN